MQAAISSDIDTLESIYRGRGCRRPGGYTGAEVREGLERFVEFLAPYRAPSTLFMVGRDFERRDNHAAIRAAAAAGHEIANHTLTHAQGFRFLTAEEKEAEIRGMEAACEALLGTRPVGFRSPGWNMGNDAAAILMRRGYTYDSSVHPMAVTPLFKALHWWTTPGRPARERTTLGPLAYMFAPLTPFRSSSHRLDRPGNGSLVEFPLTVVPVVRMPFWATFHLATGLGTFKSSYKLIRRTQSFIQYQFHLSDFVDYSASQLADQVPEAGSGLYVPQAMRMPLASRMRMFREIMDTLAADCQFVTLAAAAAAF